MVHLMIKVMYKTLILKNFPAYSYDRLYGIKPPKRRPCAIQSYPSDMLKCHSTPFCAVLYKQVQAAVVP